MAIKKTVAIFPRKNIMRIMKNLSPEHQLILNSARLKMEKEVFDSSLKLIKEGVDWESIFETAKNHNVAPLMYQNLKNLSETYEIPTGIMSQFRKSYHMSYIRNKANFDELSFILKLFNQNGIKSILIKGAALAIYIYKNIALRPMGDIDVFIRKEDTSKIITLLMEYNYQKAPFQRNYFSEFFSSLPTFLKNPGFQIEFKWGLFSYPEKNKETDFDFLLFEAIPINVNKSIALIPSINNMAKIAHMHLKKHEKKGNHQLLWYCDLREIENKYGNQKSNSYNSTGLLRLTAKDKSEKSILKKLLKGYEEVIYIKGLCNKICFVLGCLFPSKEFLRYKANSKENILSYSMKRFFSFLYTKLKLIFIKRN